MFEEIDVGGLGGLELPNLEKFDTQKRQVQDDTLTLSYLLILNGNDASWSSSGHKSFSMQAYQASMMPIMIYLLNGYTATICYM